MVSISMATCRDTQSMLRLTRIGRVIWKPSANILEEGARMERLQIPLQTISPSADAQSNSANTDASAPTTPDASAVSSCSISRQELRHRTGSCRNAEEDKAVKNSSFSRLTAFGIFSSEIQVAHRRGARQRDSPVVVRSCEGIGSTAHERCLERSVQKTLTIILRLDDAQCVELDSKRV